MIEAPDRGPSLMEPNANHHGVLPSLPQETRAAHLRQLEYYSSRLSALEEVPSTPAIMAPIQPPHHP